MADTTYGPTKVNGHVFGSESLTLSMDFWTLTTAVNILVSNDVSGNGTAVSQAALDKLVEIIAERGQPVIMAAPTVASGVYTFKFAIEHAGSWGVDGTFLVNAVKRDGVNYGFAADSTLAATLATHL